MIPAMLVPLLIKIGGYAVDYAFSKINEMPAEKAAVCLEKVKKNEEKKKAKVKESEDVQW